MALSLDDRFIAMGYNVGRIQILLYDDMLETYKHNKSLTKDGTQLKYEAYLEV